jgi:hypothetical protein
LSHDELLSPVVQQEIKEFDFASSQLLPLGNLKEDEIPSLLMDDYDASCDLPFDPDLSMPEQDEFPDQDSNDQYITAQVLLPRGDNYEKGTVVCRKRVIDGNLVGCPDSNPILDT